MCLNYRIRGGRGGGGGTANTPLGLVWVYVLDHSVLHIFGSSLFTVNHARFFWYLYFSWFLIKFSFFVPEPNVKMADFQVSNLKIT